MDLLRNHQHWRRLRMVRSVGGWSMSPCSNVGHLFGCVKHFGKDFDIPQVFAQKNTRESRDQNEIDDRSPAISRDLDLYKTSSGHR